MADRSFAPLLPEAGDRDSLNWLSTVLWPDRATDLTARSWGRSVWWASPSADAPQVLIPARSPAAARRAVRRYHDGMGIKRRFRSLLAEATMAIPPLADLLLGGKQVAAVSLPGAGRGVIDGLAELLEAPNLSVAVSLSVPKSNRKPILQLLDGSGRCLGWAKVGWNPWSEALVANEAAWLQRPARYPLVTPGLLHDVELSGRRVIVTSGVVPARRPRRRPDEPPPADIFWAVADQGTRDRLAIVESPWWHSVEAVLPEADEVERTLIEATIEACGRRRFEVGCWHGDLTPWNLLTSGSRVQLIDWELAADGAPVGFDLCHFHTQVASEMKAADAAEALERSARLSPQGLAQLGIEPANRSLVWQLYLVELVRRYLALRADGYPGERLTLGPAALDRLDRINRGRVGPDQPAVPMRRAGDRDDATRRRDLVEPGWFGRTGSAGDER